MNIEQSASAPATRSVQPVTQSLHSEAAELDALNKGLKRHVVSWQAAHMTAVDTMTSMLQRMDSILARIDRNRA